MKCEATVARGASHLDENQEKTGRESTALQIKYQESNGKTGCEEACYINTWQRCKLFEFQGDSSFVGEYMLFFRYLKWFLLDKKISPVDLRKK